MRLRGRWGLRDRLLTASIQSALQEQGLRGLYDRLAEIVPDLRDQYTSYQLERDFEVATVRGLHAFQIQLVDRALARLEPPTGRPLTVVDIGDSAGTHLRYLRVLRGQLRSLSVNVDPVAVDRIRAAGLEAVLSRAEDVRQYDISPDLMLCFETLEHLTDPHGFLADLSDVYPNVRLLITVPFLASSRVGLQYIRAGGDTLAGPETTHIFELKPEDWRLLFQFSGWSVIEDEIYRQYPSRRALRVTQPLWRSFDFEGYYGAILMPDQRWREAYGSLGSR